MVVSAALLVGVGVAAGGEADPDDAGVVDVVEVSGLIDPVHADFIVGQIADAEERGSIALVLQLNSPGSVIGDESLTEVATAMVDSEVPVSVWIGPSGAKAREGAAELVLLAADSGMAPGTRIGDIGTPRLDAAAFGEDLAAGVDALADGTLDEDEAVDAGVVVRAAPTVGEFELGLDGFETETVTDDGLPRREPVTQTRFAQLPLGSQLLHTVASPPAAYLLLVIGLGLILFELYTAGVGVAGVVGAVFTIFAGYGLDVLPARGWAVGCLVAAFVAFCVDIQTGVPRFWTGVGLLLFVIGTFGLYDGVSMSWIPVLVGLVGITLTVLAGMPAMVRTRFSTPTIGREWMIGEMGEAVGPIDPDGTVRLRDALWRARVNRATPIEGGDRVRVVEVQGLLLEVEPEEGGAKDYREMRN